MSIQTIIEDNKSSLDYSVTLTGGLYNQVVTGTSTNYSVQIDKDEIKQAVGEAIKEYARKFKWDADKINMSMEIEIGDEKIQMDITANNRESSDMIEDIILIEKMKL